MKTKMRNIAMAMALTVGTASVTASEIKNSELVLNTSEKTMAMESWMQSFLVPTIRKAPTQP